MSHDVESLLRTPDAAAFLGVTSATLTDWRYRGIGPRFVRLAKKVVAYRRGDLIDFVAARTEGGAA
jgi:predicted DNA-binding transcriptional regulator AlpA